MAEGQAKVWPDSWKDLVGAWKRIKPLEARMLEECFLVRYARDEISLSVIPNSMVAGKLLQPEVQRLLARQLNELFGFDGRFRLEARSVDTGKENLLATRVREQSENDAKIAEASLSEPQTRDALAIFKGEVESVTVRH